jgi:hypothetical protein
MRTGHSRECREREREREREKRKLKGGGSERHYSVGGEGNGIKICGFEGSQTVPVSPSGTDFFIYLLLFLQSTQDGNLVFQRHIVFSLLNS